MQWSKSLNLDYPKDNSDKKYKWFAYDCFEYSNIICYDAMQVACTKFLIL